MFTSRRRREAKPGVQIPTAGRVASDLFGAGEQGLMLSEFNTFANLFQDGPGTIPVTAVGQPVGRANDLSGRGNFATFSNCTLQQDGGGRNYLAFNGTSTAGLTSSIDFSTTDAMTVWAGVRKASDALATILVELTASITANTGAVAIFAPSSAAANNYVFATKGTTQVSLTAGSQVAPLTSVLSLGAKIGTPIATSRINGAASGSSGATQGTGNYSAAQVFIGARAGTSLFFNGNVYCLIMRGAATTAPMVSSTELYVNSRTGAY